MNIHAFFYVALGFLASSLPSFSEVFICGGARDRYFTPEGVEEGVEEHQIKPALLLHQCSCRWQFPALSQDHGLDLLGAWQCMSEAALACKDTSDQALCRGEVLSYLEKRTLIDVKPVPLIEFAARINLALLEEIARGYRMQRHHMGHTDWND